MITVDRERQLILVDISSEEIESADSFISGAWRNVKVLQIYRAYAFSDFDKLSPWIFKKNYYHVLRQALKNRIKPIFFRQLVIYEINKQIFVEYEEGTHEGTQDLRLYVTQVHYAESLLWDKHPDVLAYGRRLAADRIIADFEFPEEGEFANAQP